MSAAERWDYYLDSVKLGWFGFWDALTTRPPTDTYEYREVAPGTPEYDSAPWGWHTDSETPRYYEFKDGEYRRVYL